MELRFADKPRVLSVDDDKILTSFISTVLSTHGINLRALNEPILILNAMDEFKPDLVLLDVMMPGLSGYDVCRMLRSDAQWAGLPIVFLTSRNDREGRAAAFQAGGSDFLSKPVLAEELVARVSAQLSRAQMTGRGYHRDVLTGVMSGEAVVMLANSMLGEAKQRGEDMALCMLSVDDLTHMSILNGWQTSQDVLKELGALLRCRFRVSDGRGRFGEDGFALVFAATDRQTATEALALLQEEFASIKFTGEAGQTFHTSFSVGIAEHPEDGDSLQALLTTANKRLLESRHERAAANNAVHERAPG
jgi:diguanylate cyclase (GGDEF)-like protein